MKTTETTPVADHVVQRREVAWNLVLITLLVAALAVVLLSMAGGGLPTGSTESVGPAVDRTTKPTEPASTPSTRMQDGPPSEAPTEPARESLPKATLAEAPAPTEADKPPRTRVDRLVEMLCPVDARRRAAESISSDVPRLEHLRKLQSRCNADQAGLFGDDKKAPGTTPHKHQTEKGTRP